MPVQERCVLGSHAQPQTRSSSLTTLSVAVVLSCDIIQAETVRACVQTTFFISCACILTKRFHRFMANTEYGQRQETGANAHVRAEDDYCQSSQNSVAVASPSAYLVAAG